jgi:hypothetical protein
MSDDTRRGSADVPEPAPPPDDETGPIGIFPSWPWLYATVIAWAFLLVLGLHLFTVALDHNIP